MIYKIILGKNEISIDEEEKKFFMDNQDKKFVSLKNGDLVNVAFVQGIIIDHEATQQERKELKMQENSKMINAPVEKMIEGSLEKFKPDFLKNEKI